MPEWLAALDRWVTGHGVLIGAALATLGWLYSASRARHLARKQHTLSLISQQMFNKDFRDSWNLVAKGFRDGGEPAIGGESEEGAALQWVLNYFELLAAGVRRRDFDEQLVSDMNRGAVIAFWSRCEPAIRRLREERGRPTLFQYLEWLNARWTD